METVAVTGVAGFIGSHIAEKLLQNNFKVIGIDSFTPYYPKKIKKNNLKQCLKNKNFSFINKDLIETNLLPLFQKSQYLFHLAAQPGVRSSWGTQFETYVKENILVTQQILEYARIAKSFKTIVMASSSSVYGEQEGKMNEENTFTKPISPYGVTKLAAENLCRIYAENYNLPITSLRYFTVYGPRQRPEMAFMQFIKAALTDREIAVYGDGSQTRDFTYIDDIVDASISCIESNLSQEILNIGGGFVVSINDILKLLMDISQTKLKISYTPQQKGDVIHTEADISKATRLIDYQPKTKIRDGLMQEFTYVKNNLDLYN
jgi:UDP-glucose 4-epimerase